MVAAVDQRLICGKPGGGGVCRHHLHIWRIGSTPEFVLSALMPWAPDDERSVRACPEDSLFGLRFVAGA